MPDSSTDGTDGPRRARVLTVAALCAVSSMTFVGIGISSERSSAVEAATGTSETAAVTPMFSARRIPDEITGPQAQRRLLAAVAPVVERAPANTCVMVADRRGVLFERLADAPLVPASNQKLLTAAAALDSLGPDSTRTTVIGAAAEPDGGTVNGDLWMIGGGDPVIDTATYQATQRYGPSPHTALETIADEITGSGIRRITGSIVGDDARYDDLRAVPSWPARYITQDQVGPLSALAVNDAKTYSAIAPGSDALPAADPPGYAAAALTELLVARGVRVDGPPRGGSAPDDLRPIVEHRSLPVSDLVAEMLTYSDNNTAELLVKEMAVTAGNGNSTEAGLATMGDVLDAAGLPMDGVTLVDGSGLDSGNRVTCRLLDGILGADGPAGPLARGLAVADTSGTLRDRFGASPAAGRVRAKTGTLNTVSALSGWATTDSGVNLRFSIVMNTEGRNIGAADQRLQEQMVEALLAFPDRVDPASIAPVAPQ